MAFVRQWNGIWSNRDWVNNVKSGAYKTGSNRTTENDNYEIFFCSARQGRWVGELQRTLAPLGNLIALDVHSKEYCGDFFSNPEGIAETVRAIKPDVIVNAAAHTAR